MHHSYCKACGARDAGLRHETVCDVCDRVLKAGELRSELRIGEQVGFVVCTSCVVKLLPHAAIKVEDALGGFYPEIAEALRGAEGE